ncbi:hypothetical protein ACOMHN_027061 [Nucella lapillus]
MPLLIDFHVLAQAILYFMSVACGLVISIPLGVTTVNFHGRCLLYTECTWLNKTYMTASFTAGTPCSFPVYLSVFGGILFAVGMGAYYIYAVSRKDPNIGSQMWVLPFTLISSAFTVAFFIAACIISVGFKSFCDSLMKGKSQFSIALKSCADGQKSHWFDSNDRSVIFDGSTYYNYLHASQGASWVMVLVWVVQVALGILRIIRNQRLHAQGMSTKGETSDKEVLRI